MVYDKLRLDGKVALVTGGGRGLGKAMVLALAEAGANVAVLGRTVKEIEETAGEIKKMERKALAVPTDILQPQDVEKAVQMTLKELGQIDILVNNSGTTLVKSILDLSLEEWNRIIQTNLTGVFIISKVVGKHMVERKQGKVINIASVAGVRGVTTLSAYGASKAGVIQLTRCMAAEWARYNIRVNAIAPGYFYTSMSAPGLDNDKVRDAILSKIPLRRVGQPEELGPLVVYLASEASDFMTGETIFIDGGQSI
jgi:NAD(P)-dependent dehydrogenase (short-subunit alcohol dehydrogenase family)